MIIRPGEPYYPWEKRPAFTTHDGRTVYPVFARGYQSVRRDPHAGQINVFDIDVPVDDDGLESRLLSHRAGYLFWGGGVIQMIEAFPGWQLQGIAAQMLRIAREEYPGLRRGTQVSDAGRRFLAAVDPEGLIRE